MTIMINTIIPLRNYDIVTYPNIDPTAVGNAIPIGYGTLTNIPPTQIDTTAHAFKIVDQSIHSIDAIRSAAKNPLILGLDYTQDLTTGQFTLIFNQKFSVGIGHTYYFSVEGDFAISGSNYVVVGESSSVANGQGYTINGSRGWSSTSGQSVSFQLYGKVSVDAAETLYIDNSDTSGTAKNLRNSATDTAIGQAFTVGTQFFPTKLILYGGSVVGTPSGNVWVKFYSSKSPETQFGPLTATIPANEATDGAQLATPICNEDTNLTCDIQGPVNGSSVVITTADDVIYDIVVGIMGYPAATLDATPLAAMHTRCTQTLGIFVDRQLTFGDFNSQLEQTVLYKWTPYHDGTYGTVVFLSGTPANTPVLADEDFIMFNVIHEVQAIQKHINIKYAESLDGQTFKAKDMVSNISNFFYSNAESLEMETYLVADADAAALCANFLTLYQQPQILVDFEVHGYGLNLVPGRDKVSISRKRAPWPGGAMTNVLFRIMKIVKKPQSATTEIIAQLDTQTIIYT